MSRDIGLQIFFTSYLSGVHSIFYVSMLKIYHGDRDYIIKWVSVVLDKDLKYEEESIAIVDRDVRMLGTKKNKFVKVQWKHRPIEEATQETKKDMQDKYSQLFVDSGTTQFFLQLIFPKFVTIDDLCINLYLL